MATLLLVIHATLATAYAPSAPPAASQIARTAAEEKRYQEALDLYRAGRYSEAFGIFESMAYENPRTGVLGMIVATLASSHPDRSFVDKKVQAADAAPDDLVKQFQAGVISHYFAHQSAKTRDEKLHYYAQSIKFLDRVREAYDFEPRVFIYLAVSHFRLGNQRFAEELVERAVELSIDDPDAYYCRAEIYQHTNIERALADIDRYLEMMEEFVERGAVVSDSKQERVRRLRDRLQAVADGAAPVELFDPIGDELASADGEEWNFRSDHAVGFGVVALLAAAGIAYLTTRRRRNGAPG